MKSVEAVAMISLADLRYRARRFIVGVLVSALVLALSLLLAGIAASFHNEVHRTLNAFHADGWVVPVGDNGPFRSSDTVEQSLAGVLGTTPGVKDAEPVAILRATLRARTVLDADVMGVVPGRFTSPPVVAGRAPGASGEIALNRSMHEPLGATVHLDGLSLKVVGLTNKLTYLANTPTVYVAITDAQKLAYKGQGLAATIAVQGRPRSLPSGLTLLSNPQVATSMLEPLKNPVQLIHNIELLLWLVAAMVIGSIVYLSVLDRSRDFAVLKATGSTTRSLFAGLTLQAALLGAGAYVLSVGLARILAGKMPSPSEIPVSSYLLLVGVSALVIVAASLTGLRRSVRVEPALAFGAHL
jgi:putative ABC transport system permease protein